MLYEFDRDTCHAILTNQSLNQGIHTFKYLLWVTGILYKHTVATVRPKRESCTTNDLLWLEGVCLQVCKVLKDVFSGTHISKDLWMDFNNKRGLSSVAQSPPGGQSLAEYLQGLILGTILFNIFTNDPDGRTEPTSASLQVIQNCKDWFIDRGW